MCFVCKFETGQGSFFFPSLTMYHGVTVCVKSSRGDDLSTATLVVGRGNGEHRVGGEGMLGAWAKGQ